jgi:hypothetical protein
METDVRKGLLFLLQTFFGQVGTDEVHEIFTVCKVEYMNKVGTYAMLDQAPEHEAVVILDLDGVDAIEMTPYAETVLTHNSAPALCRHVTRNGKQNAIEHICIVVG